MYSEKRINKTDGDTENGDTTARGAAADAGGMVVIIKHHNTQGYSGKRVPTAIHSTRVMIH